MSEDINSDIKQACCVVKEKKCAFKYIYRGWEQISTVGSNKELRERCSRWEQSNPVVSIIVGLNTFNFVFFSFVLFYKLLDFSFFGCFFFTENIFFFFGIFICLIRQWWGKFIASVCDKIKKLISLVKFYFKTKCVVCFITNVVHTFITVVMIISRYRKFQLPNFSFVGKLSAKSEVHCNNWQYFALSSLD